ncbi:MAG TPA: HDOD domain-containing protein [Steroidobacteraceae bacterium]|nr:HDOD domain-containing protein [Steroidobacteraceae bacterium]
MSGVQLVWVLVGVAVLVMAIAVLARVPRRRGADAPPAAERIETSPAAAAPGASSPAAATVQAEPAELRSARLAAQQALQTLAFSAPLAPAPGAVRPRPGSASPEAAAASAPGSNTGADHEAATAAIHQTLLEIVERPNYAPRRPLLLPKLMQAMNDNEVSRRELARIIATDPALAGSLLRLANSPFYRLQPEPVESLDRAIALLGLEGMRSLISAALLQPVFRISGGMFLQFGEISWEHTLYSGAAAEAHAAVLENADPFAAQLLALIMGLATIVVFRVATDEFLARRLRPNPTALAALIDLQCAPVGRRIAASWELSERMDTALAEQSAAAAVPATALGRSLQLGRFIGALTLLHAHGVMDEEQVLAALKSGGARSEAYGRIWSRLVGARTAA